MTDSQWQYFTVEELSCQRGACPYCGGKGPEMMDGDLMRKLVAIRRETGIPMAVTSAYRCPEYNAEVSKTGKTGPHTTGHAVDVRCSGKDAHALLSAALRFGITGVGVSQRGAHNARFLHFDDLHTELRPWVWSY